MPIRDDGTSLAELLLTPLVPQALTNATATFVDSLKISSTAEKVRRGRRVVIKRRNIYSEQLADLANLYFRMSGIPDPLLEQGRRLAALGSKKFSNAQWRSFSRFCFRRQDSLHR
jgi:hypothetical protein